MTIVSIKLTKTNPHNHLPFSLNLFCLLSHLTSVYLPLFGFLKLNIICCNLSTQETRLEDLKFKASLQLIVRVCLKTVCEDSGFCLLLTTSLPPSYLEKSQLKCHPLSKSITGFQDWNLPFQLWVPVAHVFVLFCSVAIAEYLRPSHFKMKAVT